MIKKLVRHGNSWALVIDKPLLELAGITPKTRLRIEMSGGVIVIRRGSGPTRKERFRRALHKVIREHDDVLRRLAE